MAVIADRGQHSSLFTSSTSCADEPLAIHHLRVEIVRTASEVFRGTAQQHIEGHRLRSYYVYCKSNPMPHSSLGINGDEQEVQE